MRLVIVGLLVLCASCVTKSGTPIAFVPATFHEPPAGAYQRGERVRGESCEKALVFIEMNGAPLGIRLDDSAIPRDMDIALADAESKCKGCAFLANVTVDTEHRSQCLGLLVEECTIVKGTAMFATTGGTPAPPTGGATGGTPAPPTGGATGGTPAPPTGGATGGTPAPPTVGGGTTVGTE